MTKQKQATLDPIQTATRLYQKANMATLFGTAPGGEPAFDGYLQAVVIVRAIDRLTAATEKVAKAVQENTKAVREDTGMVAAISELTESVRDNTRTLRGLDRTIDNAAMPNGHPAKRL